MSRFLIASVPVLGHVNPGLAIARELVARGHDVQWYTGRRFRPLIEATGAVFTPIQTAHDPEDGAPPLRVPQPAGLTGLAAFRFDLKYRFLDQIPGQLADLERILSSFAADVLLVDTGLLAAPLVHERGGPPWATYGITALTLTSRDTAPFGTALPPSATPLGRLRNRLIALLFERVLFRDVQQHYDRLRRQLGLGHGSQVLNSTLSPYLYLQSSTPAFEYPRSDLPPQVHFIGPLLPAVPAAYAPPAWLSELRGERPVVLINQGTVATDADQLIKPALAALAGEEVVVVATTGGQEVATLGAVPPNARVEPYIPFGALMGQVSVMLTNGGYGGVQFALAHGVPLIVAGTTEEKPEIAARVAWSGAGLNLHTATPSPERIRSAVHTVLREQRYRRNAQRIQRDYAAHDAPREAATLLEQLAHRRSGARRAERTLAEAITT